MICDKKCFAFDVLKKRAFSQWVISSFCCWMFNVYGGNRGVKMSYETFLFTQAQPLCLLTFRNFIQVFYSFLRWCLSAAISKEKSVKKDLHQNNGWCLIYLLIIEFALNICNPLKPICIHPRFSWDAKLPLPLFTVRGITKPQTHCTSALNIPPAADYDPTSKFTLLNTAPWRDNTQELELAPKNGRY